MKISWNRMGMILSAIGFLVTMVQGVIEDKKLDDLIEKKIEEKWMSIK